MGRFLDIALTAGDMFTFKVWCESNRKRQDGQEYVRNAVRPRNPNKIYENNNTVESILVSEII